jgi:hypothetical protein
MEILVAKPEHDSRAESEIVLPVMEPQRVRRAFRLLIFRARVRAAVGSSALSGEDG